MLDASLKLESKDVCGCFVTVRKYSILQLAMTPNVPFPLL